MSELVETLEKNLELLSAKHFPVIDKEGIELLKSFFASNSEQIHCLNTKKGMNPSTADVKSAMKLLLG